MNVKPMTRDEFESLRSTPKASNTAWCVFAEKVVEEFIASADEVWEVTGDQDGPFAAPEARRRFRSTLVSKAANNRFREYGVKVRQRQNRIFLTKEKKCR